MGRDLTSASTASLVELIRSGDREAAAEFVRRHADLIRHRVRRRLSPTVRRLYDSQDIFSTLCRRLDQFVSSGSVRARSEHELAGLLLTIAQNAVVDKVRITNRLRNAESAEQDWTRGALAKDSDGTRDDTWLEVSITDIFKSLETDQDRDILSLWLQGVSQTTIAQTLDIPNERVWWRWRCIREKLRNVFSGDQSP